MDNVGGVEQPKRIVAIAYVLAALALGVFLEKSSRSRSRTRA